MNDQDYAEEYERRLRRGRATAYSIVKAAEMALGPRETTRLLANFKAENYPDPTRSKLAWDEETQSYVRVRTEVDAHAIDRGDT